MAVFYFKSHLGLWTWSRGDLGGAAAYFKADNVCGCFSVSVHRRKLLILAEMTTGLHQAWLMEAGVPEAHGSSACGLSHVQLLVVPGL